MVSRILEVLGRIWAIFVAFLQGARAATPSILPISGKMPPRSRFGSSQSTGHEAGRKETWRAQKEQFLRHPSLRSINKGWNVAAALTLGTRTDKGKKKGGSSSVVAPTFTIQDWSTPPVGENARPPPRPPRPPSGNLPAVIVTPCTPTSHGSSTDTGEISFPSARASPLELTIEVCKPAQNLSSDIVMGAQVNRKDTRLVDTPESTSERHLDTRDIAELKVEQDLGNPFEQPATVLPLESPRRSFILPDSLKKVSFEPTRYVSNPLSAISQLLWDSPSWANPNASVDHLTPRAPSYVTSTPVKRPRAGEVDETDLEGNYNDASSTSQSEIIAPRGLLPDDQLDLLPYPDVFDFDMYYGSLSARSCISSPGRPDSSRNSDSSEAIQAMNAFSPSETPYFSLDRIPTRSERRFGFIPDINNPAKAPPVYHEVKRYRDHYRHPAYSRPPTASESGSKESFLNQKASSSVSAPPLVLPLQTSKRAGNVPPPVPPRRTKLVPTEDLSPTERRVNPPPPIVIVSHHRFGSLSDDSYCSISDSEASLEALKARLREACDKFPKPMMDDSCSLDPVPLR